MDESITFTKSPNLNLESENFLFINFVFVHSYQLSHWTKVTQSRDLCSHLKFFLRDMFKIVNPFNKRDNNNSRYFLESVSCLLDSLNDKVEQVRSTAEDSLIKIADRKPDEVIGFVCEYKKSGKLSDGIVAVILR